MNVEGEAVAFPRQHTACEGRTHHRTKRLQFLAEKRKSSHLCVQLCSKLFICHLSSSEHPSNIQEPVCTVHAGDNLWQDSKTSETCTRANVNSLLGLNLVSTCHDKDNNRQRCVCTKLQKTTVASGSLCSNYRQLLLLEIAGTAQEAVSAPPFSSS